MAIGESTQCIRLPTNVCKITATTDELIDKVFSSMAQNHSNNQLLS